VSSSQTVTVDVSYKSGLSEAKANFVQQLTKELETTYRAYRELTRIELANKEDLEVTWKSSSVSLLQEAAVYTTATFTRTADAIVDVPLFVYITKASILPPLMSSKVNGMAYLPIGNWSDYSNEAERANKIVGTATVQYPVRSTLMTTRQFNSLDECRDASVAFDGAGAGMLAVKSLFSDVKLVPVGVANEGKSSK
jgi:hypothetical protein